MARFGLPVYPIYDELTLSSGMERGEIEWLLEHGAVWRRKIWYEKRENSYPRAVQHSIDQDVTKYNGMYVFIEYGDGYRGDDPQPELYTIHQYKTLDDLLATEKLALPENYPRDLDWIPWKWMDSKPEIFEYIEEQSNDAE